MLLTIEEQIIFISDKINFEKTEIENNNIYMNNRIKSYKSLLGIPLEKIEKEITHIKNITQIRNDVHQREIDIY
jgi:hypothetical protein